MSGASGSGSGENAGGAGDAGVSGAAGTPPANSVSASRPPRRPRAPQASPSERDASASEQQPKTPAGLKSVAEKVADKADTLNAEEVRAAAQRERERSAIAARIAAGARTSSEYQQIIRFLDPKHAEPADSGPQKAPSPLRENADDAERRARLKREVQEGRERAKQALDAGYVIVGHEYRFRTDPSRTAFRDEGKKLTTDYSTVEVARGVVDGAQAKGWRAITVTGTEEFRQRVWLEAEARNLTVRGYVPTERDRELLERAKNAPRMENSVAKDVVREPNPYNRLPDGRIVDQRDGHQGPVIPASVDHRDGYQGPGPRATAPASRPPAEQIVAMGAAPYKFDKREEGSYYIRLKDAHGKEREVWGKDLDRAAVEAGVGPGDAVRLRVKNKKPVEVVVNIRDAQDKIVGSETKAARRNEWEIERVDGRKEAPARVLDQVLEKRGASSELRERVGVSAEKEFDRRRSEGREPEVRVFDPNAARLVERAPRSVEPVRPIDRGSPTRG